MNLYPVTVVENFYENPDAVRQFALSQKYRYRHQLKDVPYVFPGCRTKDLSIINKPLFEKVTEKIISLFHNFEHEHMRWGVSTNFQIVSEEYGQGVIHVDYDAVFAAVLFLTPNAPLDSGTSLFRPNSTFNEELYEKTQKENVNRFASGDVQMDIAYHSMFDEIVRINNVYNTLVLYEGRHYHSANKFFGKTLKDSRMAQVFFVSKIDAQKHNSFPVWRSQQVKI